LSVKNEFKNFSCEIDEVPYWQKIFGEHNWKVEKGAGTGFPRYSTQICFN